MIAINAISQISAFAAILVVQTLYMILIARVLGPEDFGRFSFTWSVVQILLMGGDLGSHNTALRLISRDRWKSREVVPPFMGVKLSLSGLLIVPVLIIASTVDLGPEGALMLVLFGFGMFFHSLSMGTNIIFQAHGQLYLASLNILVIFALQAVIGSISLWRGGGLLALATAYLIATSVALAFNVAVFASRIHRLSITFAGGWEFIRQSFAVGLSGFMQSAMSRIGVALVTVLAGVFQTGLYSAAARIPQALANVPLGVFSAVLPALSAHQAATPGFRRLFRSAYGLLLAVSIPLSVFFYLLAEPVTLLVFGPSYREAVPCLRVIAWNIVPVFTAVSFSHVLLSQRRLLHRLPWITGSGLILSIGLNLVLVPQFQAVGAAWSLFLTEIWLAVGYVLGAWSFLRRGSTEDAGLPRGTGPRVAIVVQRYGKDVIGGAETLARELARRLSSHYEIEVLTSCAQDYRDWSNHYAEGLSREGSVWVRRFYVVRQRPWWLFGKLSGFLFALQRRFRLPHWLAYQWVVLQGPFVPDLIAHLRRHGRGYHAVIFFGYLYYPTVAGMREVTGRSILVPTAHDEAAIYLPCFDRTFADARYLMFLTEQERTMAQRRFECLPSRQAVAAFGVEVEEPDPAPEDGDYFLYLGRVEIGKGCPQLFEFARRTGIRLKVIGPSQIGIPPHVEHLGICDEATKRRLLGCCRALLVPSIQESLSIAALEAWALGRVVIARRGGVVSDLVEASGGGYAYSSLEEFERIVTELDPRRGEAGREYVRKRFNWEDILIQYRAAIEDVAATASSEPQDSAG